MSQTQGSGLPTQDEIATLPRRARIAFVARCARRVLPLSQYGWKPNPEKVSDLDTVISRAERAADGDAEAAGDADDLVQTAAGRLMVMRAMMIVDNFMIDEPPPLVRASSAAETAAEAAAKAAGLDADDDRFSRAAAGTRSLVSIARYNSLGSTDDARLKVVADARTIAEKAAGEAVAAAGEAADAFGSGDAARAAACTDFNLLTERASQESWNDDTPVAPEVFGPLWPNGAPKGWPADPEKK